MVSFMYEHGVMALSSFSAHQIEIWGNKFPTLEHAYQWAKFSDAEVKEKILNAPSVFLAWSIAQDYKEDVTKIDQYFDKVGTMKKLCQAKYFQHADIRDVLHSTGDDVIEKLHPDDLFWGTWPNKPGENMTGKIWMQIRDDHIQSYKKSLV